MTNKMVFCYNYKFILKLFVLGNINAKGKKEFYKALNEMKLEYLKTEGNFIYIETGRDAKVLFKQIVELGVTIRPLTSFNKPTAIRITIGTPAQNKKILGILKKVLNK
jgi:histidinol-phosphate aminotransferase